MSSPHLASAAARLLRHAATPVPPSAIADERALMTIERALSARRKRRRWLQASGAFLAVAAAAALSFGLRDQRPRNVGARSTNPQVSVSVLHGSGASLVDSAQHRARLHLGAALASGSRIETMPGGAAALHFSTGTEVALDGESSFTLEERGPLQRFLLEAGGLSAKVAKLAAGARFVIATPDAEVEVRGTQFHLAVLARAEACARGRTRLVVDEGTVEVRSDGQGVLVRAGQHWPEGCAAATRDARPLDSPVFPAPSAVARRPLADARVASDSAPSAPRSSVTAATERSDLLLQTELFAEASRAASRGQVETALGKYQALVRAYPTSALAENAVVERMRLQKGAAAKREADRYLRLYPNGFGLLEAKRILANP